MDVQSIFSSVVSLMIPVTFVGNERNCLATIILFEVLLQFLYTLKKKAFVVLHNYQNYSMFAD